MARDIEAGRAFVRLSIKENMKGLKRMSAGLKKWGASVAGIGAGIGGAASAVLGPLGMMVKQFADAGDQVDKMSARLGTSATFISALGHAANLGGSDMDTMEKGIRRLQRSALDATRGLSTQADAFEMLGVSVKGTDGALKGTEALFMDTVAALSKIENASEKAALAQMVFGRSGTALIPMLSQGKDGLQAAMAEAKQLGIVMDQEDASSAAALTDAMYRLKATLAAITRNIGGALAPVITSLSERLAETASRVVAFVRANQPAIVAIAKIAAGMAVAGAVITGLGGVLGGAGFAVSGVVAAISALVAVVGAAISPVSLVAAGAVAATVAFAKWTETGQRTVAFLQGKFGELLGFVQGIVSGISDAFKSGDIELAGKIAWAGVLVAWEQVKKSLWGSWSSLANGWDEFTTGLASMFDSVVTAIRSAWGSAVTWIAQQLLKVWGLIEKALSMVGLLNESTDIGGAVRLLADENAAKNAGLTAAKQQRDMDRGAALSQRQAARAGASSAGLAAAQQELAALLAQAATQAADKAAQTKVDQAAGAAAGAATATGKMQSLGTFSAAAAGRMFDRKGDTTAERTEENTRRTAKVLEKIERNQADGGLAFG